MSAASRIGGCLCGALRYEIDAPFGPIWNCHCAFCRRAHGAAFTTVALMAKSGFHWTDASAEPAVFETPMGSRRHYCRTCATPICNHPVEPSLLCLVVSSLDQDLDRKPWAHVNLESKADWYEVADDIPQFQAYPNDEELKDLIEANRA